MNQENILIAIPIEKRTLKFYCHKSGCFNNQNKSGYCDKHYRRWLFRHNLKEAIFGKKSIVEVLITNEQRKSPYELGIYND